MGWRVLLLLSMGQVNFSSIVLAEGRVSSLEDVHPGKWTFKVPGLGRGVSHVFLGCEWFQPQAHIDSGERVWPSHMRGFGRAAAQPR